MADPVVAQIIKSGAVLWYAPVGETIPDETSVALGADWGGNWERVGYTKEPLSMAYEDERAIIAVEEHLAPVREFRISEDLKMETVLAELTGAYLKLASGGDPDDVNSTAAGAGQAAFEEMFMGDEVAVPEYAWGFEGMYLDANGATFPLRVFIWKGTAKLNGNLEFSKKSDDYVGVPIQIHALADPDQDEGERLVQFQRVTAEASS